MAINADKPTTWKNDIAESVDCFNSWFMNFAPKAYRETRVETTKEVEESLELTKDLTAISVAVLKTHPSVLPTLRMATCPPLARDRLIGLAYANKNLVLKMEEGELPKRMSAGDLQTNLQSISDIISKMLDRDIFPWLESGQSPTKEERHRASTIVADRLCGAVSDPIIRNAQEHRQLAYIKEHLEKTGYKQQAHPADQPITEMEPGTFSFRMNVVVGDEHKVNIPVDAVIQPKVLRPSRLPLLVEAKSAGDFTNPNKRRKEEATKINQLRGTYGNETQFILFLCG